MQTTLSKAETLISDPVRMVVISFIALLPATLMVSHNLTNTAVTIEKYKPASENFVSDTRNSRENDGVKEENSALYFYRDGNIVTGRWIDADDGSVYYASQSGRLCTGRCEIEGISYYFSDDGALYTGWKLVSGHWMYFTENGALTGYSTVTENGLTDEFCFDESGYLVTDAVTPDGRVADEDGFLYTPDADLGAFSWEVADPGEAEGILSGLSIAGESAEFYMLSIAGETSGGMAVMGDRGRAYGLCQLDYRYDLADFMKWAYGRHPNLWQGFESLTSYGTGDSGLIGNQEIVEAFGFARSADYEAAVTDELEFMRARYWDGLKAALNNAGFNLDNRHVAVSASLFSVAVNCGRDPSVFIAGLTPDMTDAEMICGIYKIRNTVLAERLSGHYRKGTSGRYRESEPRMALDLLHGYVTIDSVKTYGNGVTWHGNIFSALTSTTAIDGASDEWDITMAEPSGCDVETVEEGLAEDIILLDDIEESEEETTEEETTYLVIGKDKGL